MRERRDKQNECLTSLDFRSHPVAGSLIKRVGSGARPSGTAEVCVIRPEADAEHAQSACLFIQRCAIASTCNSTRCVRVHCVFEAVVSVDVSVAGGQFDPMTHTDAPPLGRRQLRGRDTVHLPCFMAFIDHRLLAEPQPAIIPRSLDLCVNVIKLQSVSHLLGEERLYKYE